MFGFFTLLYACILFSNSIVILNEKRFLRRVGLPLDPEARKYLGKTSLKIVYLLKIARTMMRIPLIVLNIVCILYEVFFG